MKDKFKVVGKAIEKIDGLSLVTGSAKFTDDLVIPGMLEIKLLLSPHPHARILSIDTTAAVKMPGVVGVFTCENVPRIIHTTAGQGYPEPSPYDTFIFDRKVRYVGDRVAAVAAENADIAEAALKLIKVEYKILPAVLDPREADKLGAPVIHDEPEAHYIIPVPYEPQHNIVARAEVKVGNVEAGLREADVVVSQEFSTHYAQHCPMEPHIVITYLDETGRLVIRTSTQVPFHVRRIIAQRLNLSVAQIHVIKPRIGGGFGSKQEVLIEDICALVTLYTGRPARLKYSRSEEFIASRTRHPQIIQMQLGARKDGTLTAIKMDVLMNTGAYGSHGLTVLCNTGSKTLPLYHCPNVLFEGKTVYTNLPVAGAYRGYGATQGQFAMNVMMDEVAEKLGIDPLILHQKNHIRAGESSPIFQALGEGTEGVPMTIKSCELDKCIEEGAKAINWQQKHRQYRQEPLPATLAELRQRRFFRGVGMSCHMQGSSIPGIDMASAALKINDDGSFNLLVGATDLGTGSDTILAQIAAETLGVPVEKITVYSSDTDFTPFDSGAYASSTTYLSGAAVKECAEKVRSQILNIACSIWGVDPDAKQRMILENSEVKLVEHNKKLSLAEIALYSMYEREQCQIGAFASKISQESPPPFAAHFAEIEIDALTGIVRVLNYVAAVDCGTAINPLLAEGQTEGAILNGISYALTEEYIFDNNGKMMNPNFAFYKLFGTRDVPPIKTILIPGYEPSGPYGAKSVSEISINGPLPAISNAIYDALGIRLTHSPFTPEKVLQKIKEKYR